MTPLMAIPAARSSLPEPAAVGDIAFPALPALSTLLHGARRVALAADWRTGVLAALGLPDVDLHGPSRIAACALPGIQQGAGICLAAPVHMVAGMSRMFLAPHGSLALDGAQREVLRAAFNSEFGATGQQMHAAGCGWLLQSPAAAAASDGSPEVLLGAALTRQPAVSEAGRSLRRLGAEIEMWLAALPFNSRRETSGVPPINGIWFWDGATKTTVSAPVLTPGGVFTNVEPDAWVAGLARLCGLPVRVVQGWRDVRDTPGALVILQPTTAGDVMPCMAAWEQDWFEPARQDLASRHLQGLRLQTGPRLWQLPGPRLGRWFSRTRPWWQMVSA